MSNNTHSRYNNTNQGINNLEDINTLSSNLDNMGLNFNKTIADNNLQHTDTEFVELFNSMRNMSINDYLFNEPSITNTIQHEANNTDINNNIEDTLNNKESNPLFNKLVSLEVANYYCKDYFDDEDFIYMTFEIPFDLMEEVMECGNTSIIEYFESYMTNVEIADDDIKGTMYYNLYNNCVTVYNTVLEHYMPSWYGDDIPHDPSDYSKFNDIWTNTCRCLLSQIKEVLETGMNDDSIEYLCNYNKEVYTGMFIIISRLENIFSYFNTKSSLNEFVDSDKDYRNISVRLINNICVILLYLRFYYLKYNNFSITETEPTIDTMITLED